jgi:sporulation protein YabP
MAMAEGTERREIRHAVTLDDRRHLTCGGVLDVDNYDEHTVCAKTSCGILTIEGEGLHVKHLALESGELVLEGTVHALYYTDDGKTKENGGFFARLLR